MAATFPFRLIRAATFAVVSLGLGMGAHVLAGGSPSTPYMAGGLVLGFCAALPLTGRERTLGVILPLLAVLQVALHLMFASAQTALPLVPGGHGHSGLVPGIGMLITHGWAVGLTALWLARGEAVLWALIRRLGVRLGRLLIVGPCPVRGPASQVSVPGPAVPRPAVLRHVVSRRGPPRFGTATAG